MDFDNNDISNTSRAVNGKDYSPVLSVKITIDSTKKPHKSK